MYERYLMHPVDTIIELYHKPQFCLPLNSVFVGETGILQKIQAEGAGYGVGKILDLHWIYIFMFFISI